MATPVSIRLDPAVRETLERDARSHGIGLATYLRQLASEHARMVRRSEIREQSRVAGEQCAGDSNARSFYREMGSSAPRA